jgi:nitroreductase
MNLEQALNWRYATKQMSGKAVPQEKIDKILQAAHLAPSSSGLQPFKIFVITNPELKAKIQPIAFGQQQISASSHLLVFAAWDNYTKEKIDEIFNHSNQQRGLDKSSTEAYAANLWNMFSQKSAEENFQHAAKQAYISLGFAIFAAALEEVDATPMEGFKNDELDTLLDLPKQNLRSAAILALGYRDAENDWLVNLKKVRAPKDDFFVELK